jgi:transcription elongation factor GreA
VKNKIIHTQRSKNKIKLLIMEDKVFFITKPKLKELKKEYEELLNLEKVKTLEGDAPKIFESEDLNPEFVSFQEDIGFLRSRIDEIKNIIEHHELIKAPAKEKASFVDLGAKIKVDVAGQKDEFTIVGTLEANPVLGKISNESPVGKALLGHKVGDEVFVDSPVKTAYKIKSIKYELS